MAQDAHQGRLDQAALHARARPRDEAAQGTGRGRIGEERIASGASVTPLPRHLDLDKWRLKNPALSAAQSSPGRREGMGKSRRLRLDTGDAALADFEDVMLSGNEVKINIRDGLAVDAHGALPHQPPRLVGRGGKAELLEQFADPELRRDAKNPHVLWNLAAL